MKRKQKRTKKPSDRELDLFDLIPGGARADDPPTAQNAAHANLALKSEQRLRVVQTHRIHHDKELKGLTADQLKALANDELMRFTEDQLNAFGFTQDQIDGLGLTDDQLKGLLPDMVHDSLTTRRSEVTKKFPFLYKTGITRKTKNQIRAAVCRMTEWGKAEFDKFVAP